MKKNNLAVAKTPSVEPSISIGNSGYYLRIIEGFEGNSDLDTLTIEEGICAGISDSGLYCIAPGGKKASWFESFYSALQQAYAIADFWEDYDFEKPLVLSLSDKMHEKFTMHQWEEIKNKEYNEKLEESLKCIFDANVWHDDCGGMLPEDILFDLLIMFVEDQKNNGGGYKTVEDLLVKYLKEIRQTRQKKEEKVADDVNTTPQCNAFQPTQQLNMSQENKDAFEKLMKTL